MRKAFSQLLHEKMSVDSRIVVLTGDLGHGLWDKIRLDFPRRFCNVGSSEQLMLGAASGMAMRTIVELWTALITLMYTTQSKNKNLGAS